MLINKEYIVKWVDKSRVEQDSFDRFVYGFFAFNAMYSVFYDTDERRAIKDLFDAIFKNSYEEFKEIFESPEYDYFCNRRPIRNMKYDPRKGFGYPDTSRDTALLAEREVRRSNKAMLMILYQIRCNLFHGNKSFADESDQETMRNASALLLRYNEIFVKNMDRYNNI